MKISSKMKQCVLSPMRKFAPYATAAKERGQADAIRALFAKYGIASSRECPQDKRKALLSDLNAL